MNCCAAHCKATDAKFGEKTALADLERYQKRGPDPTTRDIIRGVRELGLNDASLLDVGGGIGAIQRELLGEVFQSATLVEAASAYLDVARSQDETRGTSHTTHYVHGDFTDMAHDLDLADVTTLDRVVCCYPDYARLISAAAAKSKIACVVSYPRDRWFVKLVFFAQNLGRRWSGDTFRTFVHAPAAMDRVFRNSGFELKDNRDGLVWRVGVYTRTA